jgi:starch phosphorylase
MATGGARSFNQRCGTDLPPRALHDFAELTPEKFHNVTNGISPRRFLRIANPRLAALITAQLGDEDWLTNLDRLRELEPLADNAAFRTDWAAVKRLNKIDLAYQAAATTGVVINPDAMCDVLIKRFHEYKRQILKVLHIVVLYHRILDSPDADTVPRSVVFGGKAAPGYQAAKRVIHLINCVAKVINADPLVARRLSVVFMPDYNVSLAQLIVPARSSEQTPWPGKKFPALAT